MLEARYIWNARKISISHEKFEIFAKYAKLMLGIFDLIVFIFSQWTQHWALLPCVVFFCDKFIDSRTFCTQWKF